LINLNLTYKRCGMASKYSY